MFAVIAAIFLVVGGILVARMLNSTKETITQPSSKRQVINALPIPERPFVALFPHESNKLITLLMDKPGETPELTIDLEYLSGNALKGGRTTVTLPTSLPYTQAFLLGSCSSGGKCSFDRDITTGTVKTKIEKSDEIHILKSNYVFIDGPSATTDQKLRFTPKNYKANSILAYTHGFIGSFDGEAVSEPFVITSSSSNTITGTLSVITNEATAFRIYDGEEYQDLPATLVGNELTATLNLKPWSRSVTIVRDDLKGATEDATLYLLGPIIPIK